MKVEFGSVVVVNVLGSGLEGWRGGSQRRSNDSGDEKHNSSFGPRHLHEAEAARAGPSVLM